MLGRSQHVRTLKRTKRGREKLTAVRAIAGSMLAVVALSLAVALVRGGAITDRLNRVTAAWWPVSNPLIGFDFTMIRQNAFTLLRESAWDVSVVDHSTNHHSPFFGIYNFITRGRLRTIGDALTLYGVPLTARQARLVAPCRMLAPPSEGQVIAVQADPWQYGVASWYGPGFQGQLAASGEIYNMYEKTAAHKTLPLGSMVRVVAQKNGTSTIVRINDRGPYISGRIIDLRYAAKEALGAGDLTAVYLERIDSSTPCQ